MRDGERGERLVDGEIVVEAGDRRERDRARGDEQDYSSRSAVTTGSRAARIAGSMPPTRPISSA